MKNEKRLIDANALMDAFRSYMVERYDKEKCVSEENCKTCEKSCLWRKIVNAAPTVDAVEVVHGHWEDVWGGKYSNKKYRCSVCRGKVLYDTKQDSLGSWSAGQELTPICPHCGAKMDGGNDNGC